MTLKMVISPQINKTRKPISNNIVFVGVGMNFRLRPNKEQRFGSGVSVVHKL